MTEQKPHASIAQLAEAKTILQDNSRDGGYTVPSNRLYPYQWNWDSGFIALGIATYDYNRALTEVESLMRGQWKKGMIPHIIFHEFEEHYAPGPLDWQVPDHVKDHPVGTSGITQPPIIGTILYRLFKMSDGKKENIERIKSLYTKIKAFQNWFIEKRTIGPDHNLCKILHPWESGMDNSPAWDHVIRDVPTEDMGQFRRKDLHGDNADERPHDHDYKAYMSLVYHYKRIGYDTPELLPQAHFRVFDLTINNLLLRSAKDMLRLSAELGIDDAKHWDDQIERLTTGLQTLWSEDHKSFLNKNAKTDELLEPITNASFLTLFSGAARIEQAEIMAERYKEWRDAAGYSVPTIDPNSILFEPTRYWRGPIWLNVNWMIAEGFKDYGYDVIAEEIRTDTLSLVTEHGFCEYFTPDGVRGCGADKFSWSAALALYWLSS